MTSIETVKPRRSMLAKLAAGSLLAIGLLAVGVAPASADNNKWNNGNGHGKHWKHNQGHWDGHGQGYGGGGYGGGGYGGGGYGYYHQRPPKVIYYQPAPVYYAPPPPVYYQPAPVYYQPVPVYPRRPSVSIVFPINID